jgi:hypothetical protein
MIAATAFALAPSLPISLGTLQLGRVCLNDSEPAALMRRYLVREWRPSDGGFAGWKFNGEGWSWCRYAPRHRREFVTIVRLADNAVSVAPRRWWICDPRGMPRDEDSWAHVAWRAIEVHYEAQRGWWLQ